MEYHERILAALKKIVGERKGRKTKQGQRDKGQTKVKQKNEFNNAFNKFKQYLGNPGPLYNKWVATFEANKKPYTEYNDYEEKEYVREHTLDWQDNFWTSVKKSVYLDNREHAERIDEYQKFKAEQADELDNPGWWVEDSDVLRLFDNIKELANLLEFVKLEKDLGRVNVLIDSLTKLLYGNDEAQGWFYIPKGFGDFLFFLDYALKNYYE